MTQTVTDRGEMFATAVALTVSATSDEASRRRAAYWRSLDEYADTPQFRAWAEREFPAALMELDRSDAADGGGFTRRRFMQLMAASLALAGVPLAGGCRREEGRIRPYNVKPPEITPGRALYYASTVSVAGTPVGVLAETHEGRPTKLEGHPNHPHSGGALDTFGQASILDLYDPDRSRFVVNDGRPARWDEDFLPMFDKLVAELRGQRGRGLAILSDATSSPAVRMLQRRISQVLPESGWYEHEPLASPVRGVRPVYDVSQARVIVSLDCDLLGLEDTGVRMRRAFADGRRVEKPGDAMNRLYVVEPHLTVTGMNADHRLRLRASAVRRYAAALLGALRGESVNGFEGIDSRWFSAVAADLAAQRGQCLVIAGRRQPAAVHHMAAQMNRLLDNVGRTVRYEQVDEHADLAELSRRIEAGQIETLLILNTNPAHTGASDLAFADKLARVPRRIHLGYYRDETAAACPWHVPAAHALESWGDARAGDTLSPVQPMIQPLFGGKTALELLARLTGYTHDGQPMFDPYEIVRDSFRELTGSDDFEARWRRFLHEGVAKIEPPPTVDGPIAEASPEPSPAAAAADSIEVVFTADYGVLDGRFANNGWLQECPDPITKLVWDNAAVMSPRTAEALGVRNGDMIEIAVGARSIEAPAFILPGGADQSIQLALGYGRRRAGVLGDRAGFDAYPLRTTAAPGFVAATDVRKLGRRHTLATTQEHWAIEQHELIDGQLEERAIVREGSLQHFEAHPDFAQHLGMELPHRRDIHATPPLDGEHQWGMAVDLTTCIGCNACVIACQAENNIPIVGKDEVIRGREMHWIRVDRYFRGDDPRGDVSVSTQPMLCQHCENAPCEPVCPVNATVHSEEGLNVMVYNRCIGTRYCSNNCPYKVRRFNYYDYNKGTLREAGAAMGDAQFEGNPSPDPRRGLSAPQFAQPPMQELLKMQKNPDVTVRMRGVMEKCTFCVQRIERAKIDVKVQAGQTRAPKVADGTIRTACEQSCPTQAIVFGDISDPNSRVSKLKAQPRNYAVLEHLNVRPRTTYLARLRNPNPRMPGQVDAETPMSRAAGGLR